MYEYFIMATRLFALKKLRRKICGDSVSKEAALYFHQCFEYVKNNSVALVGERTMPTERPPLVGKVSANF
jgi:hypothetical protein